MIRPERLLTPTRAVLFDHLGHVEALARPAPHVAAVAPAEGGPSAAVERHQVRVGRQRLGLQVGAGQLGHADLAAHVAEQDPHGAHAADPVHRPRAAAVGVAERPGLRDVRLDDGGRHPAREGGHDDAARGRRSGWSSRRRCPRPAERVPARAAQQRLGDRGRARAPDQHVERSRRGCCRTGSGWRRAPGTPAAAGCSGSRGSRARRRSGGSPSCPGRAARTGRAPPRPSGCGRACGCGSGPGTARCGASASRRCRARSRSSWRRPSAGATGRRRHRPRPRTRTREAGPAARERCRPRAGGGGGPSGSG